MPKYAVLGATGATGSRIATFLLKRDDVHVNMYARSETKLWTTVPEIAKSAQATAYIGALSEQERITACLDGASVIFGTLAQNANEPGLSIAETQARAIVTGLESLRADARQNGREWQAPKVVLLGSSVITADGFSQTGVGVRFIHNANRYVYDDLERAFAYIRSAAPWLDFIVAAPSALVESPPEGFTLSTAEPSSLTLSYVDLAVAMVAMAEEDQWAGEFVTIKSKGKAQFGLLSKSILQSILPGTVVTTFPASFRFFKQLGFLP